MNAVHHCRRVARDWTWAAVYVPSILAVFLILLLREGL